MRPSSTLSWLAATLACLLPGVASGPVLDGRSVCNADNCLRALLATQRASAASSFCTSLLAKTTAGCAPLPTLVNNCGTGTTQVARASSACSCLLGPSTTISTTSTTPTTSTTISTVTAITGSESTSSSPTVTSPPPTTSDSSTSDSSSDIPSTCPAPSTVTVSVVVTPSASICDAETVTVPVPTTETETETETVTATSTPEPSPGACEQLHENPNINQMFGPVQITPWGVYQFMFSGDIIVTWSNARQHGIGADSAMSEGILSVHSTGGRRTFHVGCPVRPCPRRRYFFRGTFRCHGCPAGTLVDFGFWQTLRRPGDSSWRSEQIGTSQSATVGDRQEVSLEINRDTPWSPPIVDGMDFWSELTVSVTPGGGSGAPWTAFFDNMELIAVEV